MVNRLNIGEYNISHKVLITHYRTEEKGSVEVGQREVKKRDGKKRKIDR